MGIVRKMIKEKQEFFYYCENKEESEQYVKSTWRILANILRHGGEIKGKGKGQAQKLH